MNPSSLAVLHVIAQLRLGAGRYVVDTAIEQAHGLEHGVTVCVSADVDEHWRTDPIKPAPPTSKTFFMSAYPPKYVEQIRYICHVRSNRSSDRLAPVSHSRRTRPKSLQENPI
jgi:hypothetical protein